ncbi:AIM24 family protein [Methanobrevibacter cuticularis]
MVFASSFHGCIIRLDLTPSKTIIAQKNAFLAAEENVEMSIF